MKWYFLTHLGAEPALARELKRKGHESTQIPGACILEASVQEVALLIYHIQCATRVLLALDQGPLEALNAQKALEHIPPEETFRVSSEVLSHVSDLTAMELSSLLGERIDRPVDLDNPNHVVFCQVGQMCLLGMDVTGDLSKRYYRVFSNSQSVKGTFAASILYAFELQGGVLDPFGNTGEIAIEAAFAATRVSPLRYLKHAPMKVIHDVQAACFVDDQREPSYPVWCFDPKLANLRTAKKNAKLAGVEKDITFSKLDTEWMDVKFSEREVANIVTIPPPVTKRNPDSTHIKELCYQAAFVLKGSLVVACLTEDTTQAVLTHAKHYKLSLKEESVIYTGNLPVHVMRYEL